MSESKVVPPRSIRVAGYLSYLYGIFGALSGLAAAGTFIPFAHESTYDPSYAGFFTVIAALGVAASVAVAIAGWGLFRKKSWAWNTALGGAVACVGLNAVMAAFWPGYVAFLVVVALAYGLMVVLLYVGREPSGAPTAKGVPA